MHRPSKTHIVRRFTPALAALLAILVLGACGGEEPAETEDTSSSSTPSEQSERSARPDSEGSASSESSDQGSDTDASVEQAPDQETAGPGSCPDVVVTPNSGDGLFEVQVDGISCDEATAALKSWGESGYPGDGPEGFACEETEVGPPAELRCVQQGSGATVQFETGV